MTINSLMRAMRYAFPVYVDLQILEDSERCTGAGAEWFIEGFFNPYFEQDDNLEDCPIEINIVCYNANQILEDEELMKEELLTTYAHELIHLEQYREGRYNFVDIEENEPEAYARENEWRQDWHKLMEEKYM